MQVVMRTFPCLFRLSRFVLIRPFCQLLYSRCMIIILSENGVGLLFLMPAACLDIIQVHVHTP